MAEISESESDISSTSEESTKSSLQLSSDNDNDGKTFADEIIPYQYEPLASTESTSNSDDADCSGEYEKDEDGLTPAILQQRYENKNMISSWYVV